MELPLSLITLDDSAFYNCSGLKTLVIPSGLTDSFQSAFGGCENLADISIIKSTPRVISSGAFSGAPGLKKVSVEDGITVIEESAFYNCKALTEINLPDSVNRIGDNVFANCSRLESIQLPENISYLSAWIFSNCIALKEVTIPAAVKEIKEGAFENCTLLEELTIPAEVTSIGPNVFLYDYDLTLYGFVNTIAEQYASDYSIPFVAKDNRKDIADAEVTLDNDRVVYDSGEKTPEITVSYGGTILTCNTDYTIEYRDNIQIGTGAVIVRGIGYYEGEKITTFTIYCEHQETVDPGYPAFCSVEGMTDGTYCSICGEILRSKEVIPAGHTWSEEAVYDTEPDCTSDGMMSIHCGVCNEVKEGTEVTIPALGHEFGDWEIETAAGCESAGMEVRICERCGISEYKEVSPTGHLWDDGAVTQEPEPGVEGIRTYTCTVCGEQIQKPVPALDVPHEHTYGEPEWIWTVDDGGWTVSAIFTCVDWDDSITMEADVSIDSYTQASCVQDGALVMVGSVVFHGEEYNNIHNEIIEKTGHDWETEYRVDREADCETEGIEAIHCSRCDATKAIRLISKADHVWDKGVVTKESSCTQSGEK